jgi:hypothetical protein
MRERAPLSDLDPNDQLRIADAVAQPRPPAKWLTLTTDGYAFAQIRSRAWSEWYLQRGVDPDRRRENISRAVRQQVIDRDGYLCQLCGNDVEPTDVHLDHVYPRSLGGSNEPNNLQVTHSQCNLRKGARAE